MLSDHHGFRLSSRTQHGGRITRSSLLFDLRRQSHSTPDSCRFVRYRLRALSSKVVGCGPLGYPRRRVRTDNTSCPVQLVDYLSSADRRLARSALGRDATGAIRNGGGQSLQAPRLGLPHLRPGCHKPAHERSSRVSVCRRCDGRSLIKLTILSAIDGTAKDAISLMVG